MTAVPIPPERLHRSSRRWISAATTGSRDVTYVRGTMCVPLMVNLTVKKTLIQRNERSEEKSTHTVFGRHQRVGGQARRGVLIGARWKVRV